jgi:O-antigen ligase
VFAASIALLPIVSVTPLRGDLLFPVLILAAALGAGPALRPTVPRTVAFGLATYAALNLISLIDAPNGSRAIRFTAVNLVLVITALWMASTLRERSYARTGVRVYLWSCALFTVVGVAALAAPVPLRSQLLFGGSRVRALFTDPNDFGSYLVPAAAIVLEEIARPRLLRWPRIRLVAFLLVLLTGIIFSFSRGAWVNLAVAATAVIGIYALRRGGLRGALRAVSVLAAGAFVGLAVLAASGSLSYFASRSHAQGYDRQRFGTQAIAIGQSSVHLLGWGAGQAEVLLPQPTHSLYVRALFEHGLLGLLALVLIVGGTLVAAAACVDRDGELYGVGSAALFGSFLGLAVTSAFVDTIHWRVPYLLYGLVWAADAVSRAERRRARA